MHTSASLITKLAWSWGIQADGREGERETESTFKITCGLGYVKFFLNSSARLFNADGGGSRDGSDGGGRYAVI